MTELSQINAALKDLKQYTKWDVVPYLEEITDENERQGMPGTVKTKIFKTEIPDVFLKIITETDSYDENESIVSIQFTKPVVKQVTDYEAI